MKRIIALLSVVFMIGMLMTACGDASSADKDSSGKADMSLQDIFTEIKAEVKFPEMTELTSADKLDRKYGVTEDMVDEYAGGIDASSMTMNEIVLVKAKDADSAAEIATKLQNRLDSLLKQSRNYLPEQAAVIEKCKVEKNDLYVSLIISPDAEKITEIYQKHFK